MNSQPDFNRIFKESLNLLVTSADLIGFTAGDITAVLAYAFRRFVWMVEQNDISQKYVILLGDDPIFALTLAVSKLANRLTILTTSESVCRYLGKAFEGIESSESVAVHFQADFDAMSLIGSFDTFVCLANYPGFELQFSVRNGLAFIKKGARNAGYFGYERGMNAIIEWGKFQRELMNDSEILFTSIMPPFILEGLDLGAVDPSDAKNLLESFWSRTSFVRLETLPGFIPPTLHKRIPIS